MGNCFTSSCFKIDHHPTHETAKLIDIRGNLQRQVQLPVKAAELMLEDPGHFISPAEQLRLTRRIPAMRADDELLPGKVYVLVPVGRVHCKVTEAEMAIVEAACIGRSSRKTKKNKKLSGAKVLPVVPEELREGREGEVKVLGMKDTGFPGYRSGNFRKWIPVLEPISE